MSKFNDNDRIRIIKNEDYENAFSHIVDMTWWTDTEHITDEQRQLFLYKDFFEYYNLIHITGISNLKREPNIISNLIKLRLDKELRKIEKHEYESLED